MLAVMVTRVAVEDQAAVLGGGGSGGAGASFLLVRSALPGEQRGSTQLSNPAGEPTTVDVRAAPFGRPNARFPIAGGLLLLPENQCKSTAVCKRSQSGRQEGVMASAGHLASFLGATWRACPGEIDVLWHGRKP